MVSKKQTNEKTELEKLCEIQERLGKEFKDLKERIKALTGIEPGSPIGPLEVAIIVKNLLAEK